MSAVRLVGLLLAMALAAAVAASAVGAAETRQYDAIGRLIDVAYGSAGSIHYTYDSNGNLLSIVSTAGTLAVGASVLPPMSALGTATPNPGSGPRSIGFAIAERGHATLRVLDVAGRDVATLFDRVLDPGHYNAQFSTTRWGPGVYFCRLDTGGQVKTSRIIVQR
jgi:YD repeat-containing protein